MSVNESSVEFADSHREHIVQSIELNLQIDSGDSAGSGTADHPFAHSIGPANSSMESSLAPHQRAELVFADVNFSVRKEGGALNTIGDASFWVEWTMGDTAVILEAKDQEDSDLDGTGHNQNVRIGLTDTILKAMLSYSGPPWQNTTDGTGGSGNGPHVQKELAYRDWFGEGPIFFPDDEIEVHYKTKWTSLNNGNLSLDTHAVLYWDVFDLPEQDLPERGVGHGYHRT